MGQQNYAVVIVSINHPTAEVLKIQEYSNILPLPLQIIEYSKSHDSFTLPGTNYFGLNAQRASGFKFSEICPIRHYARKSIGYLINVRDGVNVIVETDDNKIPVDRFWAPM